MASLGAPSPAHCEVEGDSLKKSTTGVNETFTIYAFDAFDNENLYANSTFDVMLTKRGDITKIKKQYTVTSSKPDSNEYTAYYKCTSSGSYDIVVSYQGEQIHGSPFPMDCKWAGLSTTWIVVIVVAGVCLLASIASAFFLYRMKCRKLQEYTPLRDTEE